MKILLWIAFLLLLLFLWGREILHTGAARRAGRDVRAAYRRFRRRTLGLFILFLLALTYQASDWIPFASLRHEAIYYGLYFILLIWLLIIAARDFTDLAESYVRDENRVTLETLQNLEKEIRTRRRGEDQRIPGMRFRPGKGEPANGGGEANPTQDREQQQAEDESER
jgi:hypothetical protein